MQKKNMLQVEMDDSELERIDLMAQAAQRKRAGFVRWILERAWYEYQTTPRITPLPELPKESQAD